ncbi:restriction endonuclease subunit S [Bradyrhizobium sp. 155]|uniref:restriction endonuclease subunit S n=1 Tax=Bradyrhizobium sp. 155 TaxID=2782629 RepID=UPI002000446D|nr:restriction endonuclease subunit S [Bradyrhizobium sp. 155]UPK14701.1 restriction endonuclease subunit S [Bradyrhizobium sp. 155]
MSDWDEVTIGDILERSGGSIKTGPFGTTLKASEYASAGVPLISVGEVGYGRFSIHSKTPRIGKETIARLPEYVLQEGDIVFGRKGAVDRSAVVGPNETGWFLGSDGIRLRLPTSCDARFIGHWLRSQAIRDWLLQHAGGTTMASLNQGTISRIPVRLPKSLAEQKAIASVLNTLDEKMELNRRMNETLEAAARAIFKDWFVDFGPTRAKSEGRASYLAASIWLLFPDRFDDEGRPNGWTTSTIGQEVEVLGGSTPSTKEPAFWGGDLSWATPKDLSSLSTPVLLSTERQITQAGLLQISSGLLPVGTVLLSSRAPIGYMAIAQTPVAVNQGFIAMVCKARLSNLFVWLWTQANMEIVHQNANGSTFQEISKANFRPIKVTIATADLLRLFDDTARPLFDRIVSNEKENRVLAATRDFLLPKLMSGEVRVGDAKQFV